MFQWVFLIVVSSVEAYHENITAVHYSIVSPGIDRQVHAGKIF